MLSEITEAGGTNKIISSPKFPETGNGLSSGDVEDRYVIAKVFGTTTGPCELFPSDIALAEREIPLWNKVCVLVPNSNVLALSTYSANACKLLAVAGTIAKILVSMKTPAPECAKAEGYFSPLGVVTVGELPVTVPSDT